VVKRGIAFSLDEEVGVFVQLSFDLLDYESVFFRRVREEKMLLVMYLSTGLVERSTMIGWRSLHSRICLRWVHCWSGSTADLVEREEAIL